MLHMIFALIDSNACSVWVNITHKSVILCSLKKYTIPSQTLDYSCSHIDVASLVTHSRMF